MNPEDEHGTRTGLIEPNPNMNPPIRPWARRIWDQILPAPLAYRVDD